MWSRGSPRRRLAARDEAAEVHAHGERRSEGDREDAEQVLIPAPWRRDLLDVLSSLDAIADCAEDIGILFTLRKMEPHDELVGPLKSLVRRVMATVQKALEIVRQMEVLAEVGFTGREADRVRDLIDELGRLEHEADIVQDDLARKLFGMEDDIKPGSLFVWNKIFNKIGDMANHAEKCGNRLRLFFAQ